MGKRYAPGELRRRVLTGFAGAIPVAALIAAHPLGLWLVLSVVSLICLAEWYRLGGISVRSPGFWVWILAGLGAWLTLAGGMPTVRSAGVGAILLLLLNGLVQLLPGRDRAGHELGWLMTGAGYLLLPFALLYHASLWASPQHWVLSLGVVMQIWAADIAAYFGGKSFGRHLLLPRISPQKTWEGALCGAAGAAVLASCWYFLGPTVPYNWFVIAGIVGVFAPLGDLLESQLKRSAGVKDSGRLLPGHGGMLDRFDGFLLTLPMIYLYLRLLVGT